MTTDGRRGDHRSPARIGIVVHPSRDIDEAVDALVGWSERRGVAVVQIVIPGRERDVVEPGEATDCELIVAIGGDGTTLAAARLAAEADRPVMGIACGSLGALTSIAAQETAAALDRFCDEDWHAVGLPALEIELEDGTSLFALNDVAVARRGEGQVRSDAHVDGTLFARFVGDGCVVSTPIGSSAYGLAAGGPLLAPAAEAFVITPVSVHGGFCPPLVIGSRSELRLELTAGHGGARLELDGQVSEMWSASLRVTLRQEVVTVVRFPGQESFLTGLRRRGIIVDSPRILAEDART